jgi:nucleoside-diphosphate-sugar epimerase
MKKIVITGATGFVGSHFLEYFFNNENNIFDKNNVSEKEKILIVCLVRNPTNKIKEITSDFLEIRKKIVDFSDVNDLIDVFVDASYVFHMAGATKGITEEDFIKGNVIPTENILKALKVYLDNKSKNENILFKRFVFISSLAASGDSKSINTPKLETDNPNPIEFYGKSKLLAENIVNEYSKYFSVTIIRPSAVYGERDVDFLKTYNMIDNNLKIFYQNKNSYFSAIYVKDLVKGIIKASLSEKAISQTYFLTNSEIISWQKFYDLVENFLCPNGKCININIPLVFLDFFAFFGEIYSKITKKTTLMNKQKIKMAKPKYWICSGEKAKNDFGFVAETNIEEGLKKTLKYHFKIKKILDKN